MEPIHQVGHFSQKISAILYIFTGKAGSRLILVYKILRNLSVMLFGHGIRITLYLVEMSGRFKIY